MLKIKKRSGLVKSKKMINTVGRSCQICNRTAVSAYNRPNSLHKTKRKVQPNLQKFKGKLICTRCLRSLTN